MKCFLPGLFLCGLLIGGCSNPKSPPWLRQTDALQPPMGGPDYTCLFTPEAPLIDGKLDDAVWKQASSVLLKLTDTSAAPTRPTTAQALWDDENLYIAFDCLDDDIWGSFTEHDSHIYQQEVVEVFIDENSDSRSYLELEVSPLNTVLDLYVLNPGPGQKFKGMVDYDTDGLRTAVAIDGTLSAAVGAGERDDRRWTVEIAIPFSQLVLAPHHPPRAGDAMRWNLYRIDRPGKSAGRDEYSAWSPTGAINYHMPDRFGWLVFRK